MASSDVEIVNSSLVKIDVDPISDLNEDRKPARLAKRQYPLRRQSLLRRYNWNFAITRSDTLAPSGTTPKFGFENRFTLPPGTLRVIGLFDDNEPQENYTTTREPFKVEGNAIYKDGDTCQFFYIADVTDVTQFDANFSELLAIDLALDIGPSLRGLSANRRADLKQDRKDAMDAARLTDAIEGSQEIIVSSDWMDSRGFNSPLRAGPIY
jgi:hypothetical protein